MYSLKNDPSCFLAQCGFSQIWMWLDSNSNVPRYLVQGTERVREKESGGRTKRGVKEGGGLMYVLGKWRK